MAGSFSMSRVHIPVRSISLPSRLHPKSVKIETQLNKLKAWELSSVLTTAPLGAETIKIGLLGLAELFNSIEELIGSPLTQTSLHHHQHTNLVEEALDESLRLLDACGSARDLFIMMKEHVQDLQSALRRKGGVSGIESYVHAFICFRKKVKKEVAKRLAMLKQMENNARSFPILDGDEYLSVVIRVLNEASAITISIFRSLLLFLSVPVRKTKAGGWSLISKLMLTGSSKASEGSQKIINEVGSVDFYLDMLHGQIRRSDSKVDVHMDQTRLEKLNASITDLEAGLDCLFRRLIQYRVSFLNILTS